MKPVRIAGLLAAVAVPLLAAEEGSHGSLMLWRVVNFAILAGLIGWLVKKHAGPFFHARSEAIATGFLEARRMTEDARTRSQMIEDRLARLDQEIAAIREKARAEMSAEHARLERQAEQTVKKIFTLAEQETANAVKAARLELKSYAISLAVDLAEKKIPPLITPQVQNRLVDGFIRNL